MTTANLSVDDNEAVIQYTSTGETAFTFPFPILAADELRVSVDQVDKTNGTDYTVSGVGDEGGGSVTFMAATTAGELITIWLDMDIQRLTGFSAGASTILPKALNDELARAVRVEQMLRRDLRRALRLAPDDPNAGQDMEIPTSTDRAGKVLGFTAAGKPTVLDVASSEDTSLRADLASTAAAKGYQLVAITKTDDETNAGATIVNGHFDVGHVLRYGTNTTPGTTDMTAAIQAAIDVMAEAGGGVAFAPADTYLVRDTIHMKSGVILRGVGWKTIFKLDDNRSGSLDTSTGDGAFILAASASNFMLEQFSIDGNDANNNSTLFNGLTLSLCSDFQVQNVAVHDVYGSAMQLLTCSEFAISRFYPYEITGATGNPGEGIFVRKCTNWEISGVVGVNLDDHCIYLSGTAAEPCTDGVLSNLVGINCGRTSGSSAFNALDGIRRVTWSTAVAFDCKRGYTIIGTADAVQHLEYIGCSAYDCDDATSPSGFSASSSSGTRHAHVRMIGCKSFRSGVGAASAVGYGFNLQDIDDLQLLDIEASENNYDGVWIDNCDDLVITGRMKDNGQEPTVPNRGGVRLDNVSNFSVNVKTSGAPYGVIALATASDGVVTGDLQGTTAPYLKDAVTPATVRFRHIPDTNSDRVPSWVHASAAPSAKTFAVGDFYHNVTGDVGERWGWQNHTAGAPGTFGGVGQIGQRTNAGSPAGSIVPHHLGEELFDTTNDDWYKATGTTNADWKQITA